MANAKITELSALTVAGSSDVLPIVDMSGTPTTKKITVANLQASIVGNVTFGTTKTKITPTTDLVTLAGDLAVVANGTFGVNGKITGYNHDTTDEFGSYDIKGQQIIRVGFSSVYGSNFDNLSIGRNAGNPGTTSSVAGNTYVGYRAGLGQSATASNNTIVGANTGLSAGLGSNNCLFGSFAGEDVTGSRNTIVGAGAGLATIKAEETDNLLLGAYADITGVSSIKQAIVMNTLGGALQATSSNQMTIGLIKTVRVNPTGSIMGILDFSGVGTSNKTYSLPNQTGSIATITSGSGAPGTTPAGVGQIYADTSGAKIYMSTGTSSSADWKILN